MAKISAERLLKIRRLRKARRLWKKEPLYAFAKMQTEYPGYTHTEFLADLKRRTKKKKRFSKSPLPKYGRFALIENLLKQYRETQNPKFGIQANQMRKIITRPYRMKVKIGDEAKEYLYDATASYKSIQALSAEMKNCKTWEEADLLDKKFSGNFWAGK